MKATGMVRRLDDLGRIVIPRDIRRNLNINEGDAMEIYVDEDHKGLFLCKYNPFPEVLESLRDARDIMDADNPFYEEVCSLIFRMEEAEE